MSYSNDYKFYGMIPNIDMSAYFAGKPVKKITSNFDADKAEFFGEYTAQGASLGSDIVPGIGTVVGGVVGLLADAAGLIWPQGPPEDTSDVGYQAALAQREAERYAIAQAKAKQAEIQAQNDARNKQTKIIVITLIGVVLLIGGSLLFFTKKK